MEATEAKSRSWLRRWARRAGIVLGFAAVLSCAAVAALWRAYPFPLERIENWPASPCITDCRGQALLQRVAADGQWRMPVKLADISRHAIEATIAVEDSRFYSHCGVDALACLRAAGQNVRHLRTVSGASTLTMQVCRMMDDRPRTLWSKAVESFRALQLERLYSKDQILQAYLNIAPYGRNLRGIEAASLTYFGKHARDLSLAEAALLAGLPQSPNRYRPDVHRDQAERRRQTVLARMEETGVIGPSQAEAARADGAAAGSWPHAARAPHAAWMALSQRPRGARTTLDLSIQQELETLCARHGPRLPEGSDIAAAIVDIPTGDLVAMIGSLDASRAHDGQVNGATAWRSPGSALKPFIYAAAFEARRLEPNSTVYDIPIHRAGWSPGNFDKTFCGPLSATDALRRSLNVPAILVAEGIGLSRCRGLMEAAGLRLGPDAEARGGLSLVTGGIEVRLIDLVAAYATVGRGGMYRPWRLLGDEPLLPPSRAVENDVCLCLDDILSSRRRRPHGMEQLAPEQVPWFAWKTGTSSSRRDALAAGHNGRYAIGVWVGRFNGQGDGGFVGGEAAEPLLAELFALPALRADGDRPAPPAWAVRFPLPPPAEMASGPAISYPHNGAVFLALGPVAIVQPRAVNESGLSWFLNGLLIDPLAARRMVLPRGAYELRCANEAGNSSCVRFSVK